MSIRGKLAKGAGVVAALAAATRIGEAAGVRRLQCGCEDDCWCKRPGPSLFRWLVPGKFHHLRPPEDKKARADR